MILFHMSVLYWIGVYIVLCYILQGPEISVGLTRYNLALLQAHDIT